jgi:hypothetical protein
MMVKSHLTGENFFSSGRERAGEGIYQSDKAESQIDLRRRREFREPALFGTAFLSTDL